ncbi:CHASE2 domain-containing protein [uncultured Abyssibacter sp.]|uniref:CHASE2 domain-containing protein n=1 Tax=uncultured Abyssibacter sp. TaxID=2320202 RepID=UPI0032B1C54F
MHQIIRYVISLALFALVIVHLNELVRIDFLEQVENSSYDARVRATMPGTVDSSIVIVDIDERSMTAEGYWPWERDKFARMVNNLFEHYAVRAVGFDILFAEPQRSAYQEMLERLAPRPDVRALLEDTGSALGFTTSGEAKLAAAIRGRPVVLGMVLQSTDASQIGELPEPLIPSDLAASIPANFIIAEGYSANLSELQGTGTRAGFFDNPLAREEIDGVFRRVPLMQSHGGAIYGSLAFELARIAMDSPDFEFVFDGEFLGADEAPSALALEAVALGDHEIPVDGEMAVMVPYRGRQGSFEYVSATDVIHQAADAAVLRDAIVLVGTSAPGLLDLRNTPVGSAFAGVEVHANIISGILEDRIKYHPAYATGLTAVMLLVISLAMAWVFPRVSAATAALLGLGFLAAITAVSLLLWTRFNMVVPLGLPLAFTVALFLLHLLYGYFVESRGKREVTRLFGQYVPPELVDEMAENPEDISMEGETRELTVLFSDVRGFTTISEGLDSRELSQLMNEFLTPLTRVIHEHRGTIDKYMGDAIMAFWGAPLEDPDHARHALQAAMDMLQAVRALDETFEARGWPRLNIGVGLNTGPMSVGNMGSEFRVAYTVMGDAVNLGSRLEGQTKNYGVEIIVSESTRAAVPEFAYRELDRIRVKGKQEPVTIYEPLGDKDSLPAEVSKDLARYRQALRLFRSQAWDQAEAEFFGLQQSGRPLPVYALYQERIAHYRANPPGEGWDGVYTHTSK